VSHLGDLSIDSVPASLTIVVKHAGRRRQLDAGDCSQTFVDNCQVEGIDLNDAFHPTAKAQTLPLIFACINTHPDAPS